MTIKSHLSDPKSGVSASVQCDCDGDNALVVATKEYQPYTNFFSYFTNETYGNDMAQDATASGTPERIHDGEDTVLWTGTQVAGGSDIDFNSSGQAYVGTQSVYFNRLEVGDVGQFAKGSDVTLANYVSLTIWVYVTNNYATGDTFDIYWWDTDTATQVGNTVLLQSYININNTGTWQQAVIPLGDMGISTQTNADALRVQCTGISGVKPRFYWDEIELQEAGEPILFTVEPDLGEELFVTKFQLTFADAYAGTVADGTLPNIPYDAFFGFTPVVGINLQRHRKGEVGTNVIWTSIIDIMNQSNATISGQGSDGTNSWCSIVISFERPLILEDLYKDNFTIILSDDWSQLLHFKVSIGGYRIEP